MDKKRNRRGMKYAAEQRTIQMRRRLKKNPNDAIALRYMAELEAEKRRRFIAAKWPNLYARGIVGVK